MPLYMTLQHLLNVLVQIRNKAGFYKKNYYYYDTNLIYISKIVTDANLKQLENSKKPQLYAVVPSLRTSPKEVVW
jgi:hypothetical protein